MKIQKYIWAIKEFHIGNKLDSLKILHRFPFLQDRYQDISISTEPIAVRFSL